VDTGVKWPGHEADLVPRLRMYRATAPVPLHLYNVVLN